MFLGLNPDVLYFLVCGGVGTVETSLIDSWIREGWRESRREKIKGRVY